MHSFYLFMQFFLALSLVELNIFYHRNFKVSYCQLGFEPLVIRIDVTEHKHM